MTDNTESDRPAGPPEGERIAKVMARAGLCSRRDAERWIADGRVAVNGQVLTSPAFNVAEGDKVMVDGRPIARRERTRLFMFHKPRGTVTTDHDPEGRATIFDVLPEDLPRLITIGRLDINTEGLLLLTNDGGLARVLELPATGWLRRYRVRAHGDVDQAQLDALADGVVIEGVEYRGIEAKLDRTQGANVWLTMGLREGKNREIKRVLEHLGLSVNRLIRLSYGPFQLGDLEDGAIEEVKTRILQDQLGEALAAEAGVDFDAPVFDRKDREKIARRHPNDEPQDERSGRGAGKAPARGGDRGGPRRAGAPAGRAAPTGRAGPGEKRKHISVLRGDRNARDDERKVEIGETADRRGRKVAVERVAAREVEPERERADSRNGRRFAQERRGPTEERRGPPRERRDGERPPMRRRDSADGAAPREGRAGGRFEPRGERKAFAPRGERKDFAPRGDRKDFAPRGERKDFAPRGERKDFAPRGDRKDFAPRGDRKDFAPRGDRKDFAPRGERKDFAPRGDRKDFAPRGDRKDFAPRGERKPGGEAGAGPAWSGHGGGGFRNERPEGDRPARAPREGGRFEGAGERREPARTFEKRGKSVGWGKGGGKGPAPRGDVAEGGRSERSGDARPPRASGRPAGRSGGGFAGKSGGKFGGKPAGKPGGRFGGGKPGGRKGGRPAGGGRSGSGGRPGGRRGAD